MAAQFDAFISYSRHASSELATDLQTAVERFAKPWYRMRAIRVFRDDASMSANTALWSNIEQGLQQAEWFVLLASPAAAASEYVGNEVTWWLQHKSSDRIILVLEEGVDIVWDRDANDFDWDRTDSLPRALSKAFAEEPRWIDLRWYVAEDSLKKADPRWNERVADVAAAVRFAQRDQLIGENVREHRRAQRLLRGGIVGLSLLLVASLVATFIAVGQSREARRQEAIAVEQARVALSRALAAQAINQAGVQTALSLLLAVEGYRRDPSLDATAGLAAALEGARYLDQVVDGLPDDLYDVVVTPDGTSALLLAGDGTLRRYDTRTWRQVGHPLVTGIKKPIRLAVSPDGAQSAYLSADGVGFVDLTTGALTRPSDPNVLRNPNTIEYGPEGRSLIVSPFDGPVVVLNTQTGRQRLRLHGNHWTSASISPTTGEIAALRYRSVGGKSIELFDPGGRRLARAALPVQTYLWALRYNADGQTLLTQEGDGIRLVDARTLRPEGETIVLGGDDVADIDLDPSGELAAIQTGRGRVVVVKLSSGSTVARFSGSGGFFVNYLDSTRLVTIALDGSASLLDLADQTQFGRVRTLGRDYASGLAATSEGLVIGGFDDALALGADGSHAPVPATWIGRGDLVNALAASIQGDRVALSLSRRGEQYLRIVDVGSGEIRTIQLPGSSPSASDLAFSADGSRLLMVGERLTVYDVESGKQLVAVPADVGSVAAFAPTGHGIVVGAGGPMGKLAFLDPETGQVTAELDLADDYLTSVRSFGDGPEVLVAALDGTLHVVDTDARTEVGPPIDAAVAGVAVPARHAAWVMTQVGVEGHIRLWDRATRRPIGPELSAHRQDIAYMTLTPSGDVVSLDFSGRLVEWDLDPESWVEKACGLAGRNFTEDEWASYLPDVPYRQTCTTS